MHKGWKLSIRKNFRRRDFWEGQAGNTSIDIGKSGS